MHKSMLAGFIIDCETGDLDKATAFWAQALGLKSRKLDDPAEADYSELLDHQHGLHIEVQRVTHPSRVHLDIQSDDIDAEAARLEKLGARRIAKVKRWWVMEAPTGQRFCVVRPQAPDFAEKATVWK
jgi:predicted enzyme related to lactoylglutathione lyase